MTDPPRIREAESGAPAELRELFHSAGKPEPLTPVVEASLAVRIGTIATESASPLLPWLAGGTVILAGAVAFVASSEPASSTAAPARSVPTSPPSFERTVQAAPSTGPSTVPMPSARADRPLTNRSGPPVASAPNAGEDALAGEARLLNEAHRIVVTDPARALAIAQEHARRYPRGQLSAERELIRVQALVKMGRSPEAEARGRELRKSAPSGIYRDRLDTILQEK